MLAPHDDLMLILFLCLSLPLPFFRGCCLSMLHPEHSSVGAGKTQGICMYEWGCARTVLGG